MAALELASSTASPLPNLNASHDPDFDSFLNLDQTAYPISESMKSNPSLLSQPSMAPSEASINDMGQSFSAPSHQYGDHQQQTGFPPDAVAHAMAYNENSLGALRAGHQGFPIVDGHLINMKREGSTVDFSTAPSRSHSEMDIETDNSSGNPYFLQHANALKSQQFIDPTALGGHEMSVIAHPAPQAGRVYPGMHQQQAAMARAAQQHKQQQQVEIIRQQQQQQLRQRHAEHLARQTPTQPFPTSRPMRQTDPVVEERISRLLQQMRQNSLGQDHMSTPTPSSMPQMAKLKKDEDDMDDDERLLASEEGKKLTSKERRQLRNKVSARAFRSRRKEYITQLEGEVASKTSETNELRMQNHALMEENSRLTDLTRMLLSSPHLSDVLNELNANGLPHQFQTTPQTQPQPQSQPQPAVSQAPMPSNVATDIPQRAGQEFPGHQQNFQVNMVMVPDNRMDVYASGWNSGIDMNYTNASVFAVLEVPEGPAIDSEVLSGKSSNLVETTCESSKVEVPQIERPPVTATSPAERVSGVADPTYELDESDPCFALFLDDVSSNSTISRVTFTPIQSEKPSQYKLAVEPTSGDVSASAVRSFERLCSSMDAAFERVCRVTDHLLHRQTATLASLRGLGRVAFRGISPQTPRRPTSSLLTVRVTGPAFTSRYSSRVSDKYRSSKFDNSRGRKPDAWLVKKTPTLPPLQSLQGLHVVPAKEQDPNSKLRYIILDPKINSEPDPSLLYPRPMKYSYQVLSTPTADTPGSAIILQYEGRRYLFGHVAEGTQRNIVENGHTIASLNQMFITGKTSWANYGGLMGMVLSIADVRTNSMAEIERNNERKRSNNPEWAEKHPPEEIERLSIHGGKNVNHLLATARRFIFRKNMPIVAREYDSASLAREPDASGRKDIFEKPTWSDEHIKVWAMSIKPSYERTFEGTKSGFKSPRKRSLNEFEEREEQVPAVDPKANDQLLREHIVKNMFDSDWRTDTLHEAYLPDVEMPATVFVRNPETKDIERYKGVLPGGNEPVPKINVLVRKPWPAALIERLPATNPSSESMCYFVRSEDQRGKFEIQKAQALGIPRGPAFSQLASGQSHTMPDGKVITPDMVLGSMRPGKTVAIIDIPSELYIDDLLARPEWQSPTVTGTLSAIFWILGPGVGEDPRIIEFASRIKNCDHVVCSTDYCPNHLTMMTAAKSTLRLAKLNSADFPVPVYDNVTLPQSGTRPASTKTNASSSSTQKPLPWKPAKPGLTMEMEPKYFFNEDTVIQPLNHLQFINRIPKAVTQRVEVIRKRLRNPEVISKFLDMREGLPPLAVEAEVVTLGTGSSIPSKYRNVSATLLHVPGKGYYLFDCGENTLGQLKRVYGPEKLREVMQNLRLIWVSHLHADHHLGAVSVIKEWHKVNYSDESSGSLAAIDDMEEVLQQRKRLCVISDGMFIQWLEEYAGVEDFGFSKLLPLSTTGYNDRGVTSKFVYRHVQGDRKLANDSPKETKLQFQGDANPRISALLRSVTGLENVHAVLVHHCRAAMAVTLEWEGNFKVSYSGDCRPSNQFALTGKDSTLLIHEATFQDDLRGQADAKKHSTTAEAISIGRRMNARMLLLTHFSQRYAKISKIDSFSSPPSPHDNDNDRGGRFASRGWGRNASRSEVAKPVAAETADSTLNVPDGEWPGDGGLEIPVARQIQKVTAADSTYKPRPSPMPICMAFDYMKVKIRDIPVSQMFAPAFERLVERLERASGEESHDLRVKELATLEAKMSKKKVAKGKKGGDSAAGVKHTVKLPSRSASTERKHSAWSASESESGWTDESDVDADKPEKGGLRKGDVAL